MEETLDNILNKSEELFFKVGIKSITMDDISRELGISKKTLYLYVSNKADLVDKVMNRYIAKEAAFMEKLNLNDLNAIDVIIEIVKHVHVALSNLPLSAIYDLQKYYPKSWAKFTEFKNKFIYSTMQNIIAKGKKENLFRKEIKENLVARFYVMIIEGTLNPTNFSGSPYSFKETYIEYIIYHLRGLVSDEGTHYLKNINLNNE